MQDYAFKNIYIHLFSNSSYLLMSFISILKQKFKEGTWYISFINNNEIK